MTTQRRMAEIVAQEERARFNDEVRREQIRMARAEGAAALTAAVRSLADEWQRELDSGAIRDPDARYCWRTATRELTRVLDAADPERR